MTYFKKVVLILHSLCYFPYVFNDSHKFNGVCGNWPYWSEWFSLCVYFSFNYLLYEYLGCMHTDSFSCDYNCLFKKTKGLILRVFLVIIHAWCLYG